MREIYLLGCLVLGAGAVFATMSVAKYEYKNDDSIPKDISYTALPVEAEADVPLTNRESQVMYERDAFSALRGKPEPEADVDTDVEETPQGSYTFELRGINIVGAKKVALITATPIRTSRTSSRSSRPSGRTSSVPVTSKSSKVHIVELGEEIDNTGYTVKDIVAGKVMITDSAGKDQPPLFFSLTSDESLKRAEMAYKAELSRQKSFSKQNQFSNGSTKTSTASKQPTTTANPKSSDPKQMTKEQREAEMRKRAENLKEEMKRLKELREQSNKEVLKKNSDSKSKR